MTSTDELVCIVRGGGDLATGVTWRLTRAGITVVVTELAMPLTVRRSVALSTAVADGSIDVEGMIGQRAATPQDALAIGRDGGGSVVGVVVSPELPDIGAHVVVDARLAKRNIDTSIDDAPLVIGLGPGFTAGLDCHAVVETMRGPHLGRVLWTGSAEPDTGTPGLVGGRGSERVIRAQSAGTVGWVKAIGDIVDDHEMLGTVGDVPVLAPFGGVIRGLILDGIDATAGLKIGDIDPRLEVSACHEISDKALAIGGGVVEAVLWWTRRTG